MWTLDGECGCWTVNVDVGWMANVDVGWMVNVDIGR